MTDVVELSNNWLIFLTLIAFSAGYIDAIAGGGGMLNLPALLFAGLPPVAALAVNKITGISGTSIAVIKYSLNKNIHWETVFYAAIPCFFASYLGGKLALYSSDSFLSWAIILCIPIALYIVITDKHGKRNKVPTGDIPKTLIAISPIGFYDGLLGPGTGTYMTIALRKILNFDYLTATATVKPLNFLTNLGAVVVFLFADQIIWSIAIPMIFASSTGAWIGSHFAIKGGENLIKKLLVVVLVVMLLANLYQLIY